MIELAFYQKNWPGYEVSINGVYLYATAHFVSRLT